MPGSLNKAKSSMGHLKVGTVENPKSARPTTPNVPAKTQTRAHKDYSKPWLINTAVESQDA